MLEKDIVAAIMRYLNSLPRCFAWKTHGNAYARAGLPDIICCFGGRFFAFEVKTTTGKATKLQLATIKKIKQTDGIALVVRSVDEVQSLIENKEVIT